MCEEGDRGRTTQRENEISLLRLVTLTIRSKSLADGPSKLQHRRWPIIAEGKCVCCLEQVAWHVQQQPAVDQQRCC